MILDRRLRPHPRLEPGARQPARDAGPGGGVWLLRSRLQALTERRPGAGSGSHGAADGCLAPAVCAWTLSAGCVAGRPKRRGRRRHS